VSALALLSGSARAQAPSPAALFDEGVKKFKQADYEGAAEAFFRADEAAASDQALLNAIAAGRRGHAHLWVARAAERAIGRDSADAELKRLAREALVEASEHLARIDLSCAPAAGAAASCAVEMDGAQVAPGIHHVLPGTHRFTGAAAGARAEEPLTCSAGARYTVVLRPAAPGSAPGSAAPLGSGAAGSPSASAAPSASGAAKGGWPRAVVIAGSGAAAVLAGVSIWSGVDAIDAKNKLPAEPFRAQNEDVLARAHRTDGLLAGAAVVAAFTVVAAVWLVDWSPPGPVKAAFGVAPSPSGAAAVIRGGF
jgi:hypothetical protein